MDRFSVAHASAETWEEALGACLEQILDPDRHPGTFADVGYMLYGSLYIRMVDLSGQSHAGGTLGQGEGRKVVETCQWDDVGKAIL